MIATDLQTGERTEYKLIGEYKLVRTLPQAPGRFGVRWHFLGWWHWSLGLNIYLPAPNVEVHCPFGFFRIGRLYETA